MSSPLKVICWKWKPRKGYRSTFNGEAVNVLRNMVKRNYSKPHEFVCITDDPTGIDKDIRIIPLWQDHSDLINPMGPMNPSCYRRLRAFSVEARGIIGERFVSIDLDTVVVGPLDPILDRTEDFLIWGDTHPKTFYNGSFWMMTAGARRQVWDDFDPIRSPLLSKAQGHFGSDQGWISYRLGPNEVRLGERDGLYSFRVHIAPRGPQPLPSNARLIFFHGKNDPWMRTVQNQHQWIRKHYY